MTAATAVSAVHLALLVVAALVVVDGLALLAFVAYRRSRRPHRVEPGPEQDGGPSADTSAA